MRWWATWRLRLRSLFRRTAVDRELDAELRFHLDEQIAELIAGGMSPHEARASALRAIGGSIAHVADECRDARRIHIVDSVVQDLRFATRMLAKNPAFTLVAVATLAVGIGFNTLAFSVTRALLFGALPVEDPDRLVLGEGLREGFDPGGSSLLQYAALRRETSVFANTSVSVQRPLLLRGRDDVEQLDAAAVAPGFFETLGTRAALGRTFTTDESRPGGPPVVLLSYGVWQRRFGGDPNVVGSRVVLDDRPYTVVGVMPPAFDYPTRTEAWVSLELDPDTAPPALRVVRLYIVVARLRRGVTFAAATQAVKAVAARLQHDFPATERGWSYGLLTMRQWSIGDDDGRVTQAVFVLLAAIAFLLVICSVNVASLLLVRGVVRERELATRIGLGASPRRIAQQLFTEGALLSLIGAAAGLALAGAARPLFIALNPIQPHAFADVVNDLHIDARALWFCLATSIASSMLFTLVPAVKLACVRSPVAAMRAGDARSGGVATGRGWLRTLVVTEIATALLLSFGGALLTKSFYRLGGLDLGFRPAHLLTLRLPLSATAYPRAADKFAFLDRVLRRMQTLPGVNAAGLTTTLPMQEFAPDTPFTVEGQPPVDPAKLPVASLRHVSVGYAEALGLTLVKGRFFTDDDRTASRPVAVVTEELARQAFGAADPIGKRLRRGREQDTAFPWLAVVGIVRDAKEDRLNFRIARPVLYIPYLQRTNTPVRAEMALVVRTDAEPTSVARDVRAAIRELNASQPVLEAGTMQAMIESFLSTDRFSARLMAILAAAGLLLAGVGLYSVLAYAVSQRTAEIGLRVALGAQASNIAALVTREVIVIVMLGVAVSLPAMAGEARLLSGVLFGVSGNDGQVLLALVLALTALALAACVVPVWRALRLDPVQALMSS